MDPNGAFQQRLADNNYDLRAWRREVEPLGKEGRARGGGGPTRPLFFFILSSRARLLRLDACYKQTTPSFLSRVGESDVVVLRRLDHTEIRLACRRSSAPARGTLPPGWDFSALDANFGLGWDLACRMVCSRGFTYRNRFSVSAALLHPFFWTP